MNKKNWPYLLILAGLCFLVYANSLTGAFISDDIPAIIDNPKISSPFYYLAEPTDLINSFCYLTAKNNPLPYHLTSILTHSIATILVFFFLNLFFKRESSLLAACLFAVHPVHTEAVAWISGRTYPVLAIFILIVYLLYHHAAGRMDKKLNTWAYVLCLAIFSYFSVKNFVFYALTPVMLVLSDIIFARWRRNWKLWLPFFIILAIRLIFAKAEISARLSYLGDLRGPVAVSGVNPVNNLVIVLFSHLYLLLWPLKLTLFHEPVNFSPLMVKAGFVALSILLVSLPFIFKKAKELFLAVVIFILFFSPLYSPVSISSMWVAERYLYFPAIALSIFAAFFYEKYLKVFGENRKRGALAIFLVLMLFYGARTVMRNEDWKSPEKFWHKTIEVSPESYSAYNALGLVYQQKAKFTDAITSFKKAAALNGRYALAYANLGNVYSTMGKLDEAVTVYNKALEINPKDTDVYYNLGNTYVGMGKLEDAATYLKKAIEINPQDAQALNNLGLIYIGMGKTEEPATAFKKAISIQPDYGAAYLNLCTFYSRQNKPDLAKEYCDKAAKLGYVPKKLSQ